MKTNRLFKIFSCFLAILLFSCEQDRNLDYEDAIDPEIHFSLENEPVIEYVDYKRVQSFVTALEKRTGKSTARNSGSSFIDTDFGIVPLDNALLAIDSLGRENVSFRLIPDEPNPKVIFNLVVEHANEMQQPTIYVMALEKSEAYYQAEISGDLEMSSFSGKLYRYPINDAQSAKNPFTGRSACDPIDINPPPPSDDGQDDTNPGGGNSSGSGSGTGNGGSNGGSNGGGLVPDPCTITQVCAACSVGGTNCHSPAPQGDGSLCSGSLGSAVYYISGDCEDNLDQLKAPSTSRNDCVDSDGPVGINLYDITNSIEEKIQSLNLDPCSGKILLQLQKLEQHDIASILNRFGAPNNAYDWELKTETPTNPANAAETDWKRDTNDVAQDYEYETLIKPSYVNQATEIAIARTILHELVHTHILSHIDDVQNQNLQDINDFSVFWDIVREKLFGNDLELQQHEFMAQKFVTPLRDALKEWDNSSNPNDQYYEDLAWGALIKTSTFSKLHPSGSNSRNRIININAAEDTNSRQNGVNPKGSPCN